MKKEKKFDAIKRVRDIRDPLSERYYGNPELFLAEMEEVNRDLEKVGFDGFFAYRQKKEKIERQKSNPQRHNY